MVSEIDVSRIWEHFWISKVPKKAIQSSQNPKAWTETISTDCEIISSKRMDSRIFFYEFK